MNKKEKEKEINQNMILIVLKNYFNFILQFAKSAKSLISLIKGMFNSEFRNKEYKINYWANLKDGFKQFKKGKYKVAKLRFKIANWNYKKIYKKNSFLYLYQMAKINYILGKYKDAIQFLKLASDLTSNPNNIKLIGIMYSKLK